MERHQTGFKTSSAGVWSAVADRSGRSRSQWAAEVLDLVAAGQRVPKALRGGRRFRSDRGTEQVVSISGLADGQYTAWAAAAAAAGLTVNRWACIWLDEVAGVTDLRDQLVKRLPR